MNRPAPRPRLRDHGLTIGALPVGPANAITDVDGVRVGHRTLWIDDVDPEGNPVIGRTGVTAIVPAPLDELFAEPMVGGVSVLNGAGELTGSIELAEWGLLETPILLTGTSSVGRAYDAVVDAVFDAVPSAGIDDFVIPVVGECDDSWLDQARRRFVTVADARAALDAARQRVGRACRRRRSRWRWHGHDHHGLQGRDRHVVAAPAAVRLHLGRPGHDELRLPGPAPGGRPAGR